MRFRNTVLTLALSIFALQASGQTPSAVFRLNLRSRVEAFKGSGEWHEVRVSQTLPVHETALLICDMWDNHWCSGAARRVSALVRAMAPVVDEARSHGIQIIHAPSEVMPFYATTPQRQRMMDASKADPPASLNLTDPPLPIDDSNGGCDTPDQFYRAWSRQHAGIHIAPEDGISDNGSEVYSFLRQKGIKNLLVMGVHTNMCVLRRSFAIKQMTNWGIHCILVRDLTDSMYNPNDRPFVGHDQGTELVVQHIEKYWAPSILSAELLRALRAGSS